jgi:hypothetical protein
MREGNNMNKHDRLGDQLQAFYIDYVNNYLTVACIAEHNGLTENHASTLIQMGRKIHNIRVDAWKYCQNEVTA